MTRPPNSKLVKYDPRKGRGRPCKLPESVFAERLERCRWATGMTILDFCKLLGEGGINFCMEFA